MHRRNVSLLWFVAGCASSTSAIETRPTEVILEEALAPSAVAGWA